MVRRSVYFKRGDILVTVGLYARVAGAACVA